MRATHPSHRSGPRRVARAALRATSGADFDLLEANRRRAARAAAFAAAEDVS